MATQADRIRRRVKKRIVDPARNRGDGNLEIGAWIVHGMMGYDGPGNHRYPTVCQVLKGNKFLKANNLELVEHTTPRPSSTTVFRYRLLGN